MRRFGRRIWVFFGIWSKGDGFGVFVLGRRRCFGICRSLFWGIWWVFRLVFLFLWGFGFDFRRKSRSCWPFRPLFCLFGWVLWAFRGFRGAFFGCLDGFGWLLFGLGWFELLCWGRRRITGCRRVGLGILWRFDLVCLVGLRGLLLLIWQNLGLLLCLFLKWIAFCSDYLLFRREIVLEIKSY